MRILPTSFSKSLFLTLLLSLAAHGAFAQTEVNITGFPADAPEGCVLPAACSGTTSFVFTVTRTGPALAFNVFYTITGDVVAPEDFTALSGTLAFTAAQTTRTISVAIRRDSKFEIDEALTLTLTGADNGAIVGTTSTDTALVLNDDTQPTISIGDRTVTEGGLANFAVTLSNGSYLPVSVTATTADGTANGVVTAPFPLADYTTNAPGGTPVTFAANATVLTQNVGIQTINDAVYEGAAQETFFVNLSGEVNGTLGTATGNGLITDNDPLPTVSITGPPSQQESISPYTFTISLSRQSVDTIQVMVDAVDGTAQQIAAPFPQADFSPLSQLLTFTPGQTSQTVDVTVIDDAIDEANETFAVQLSGLVNVNPGTISRTGTINDNDGAPQLSIVATSSPVAEGAGNAIFTVSIGAVSGRTVSVTVQTVPTPGTAIAGADYTATGPTVLTWTPGDTTPQAFVVPITGDNLNEVSETFRATLTSPVNATPSPSTATMTIADDDPIPTVSIGNASVTEGNTPATTVASFTVSLSAASGQTITVRASTANGTATTANNDYVQRSNVLLTFSPLQTTQQFDVTVNGDDVLEVDETFVVNLSSPSATVTILTGQGTGTINNDDSPALSIDDAQIGETNSGQVSLNFDVHIPGPAPVGGVAFDFDTSDGTATVADSDYDQVISGSGFIAEGDTSTTVTVFVNGDAKVEAHETFTVTISNATLPSTPGIVTILDNTATGTISNDDAVPVGALVISEFRLSGPGGASDEFIEIANTTSSDITVYTTDSSGGFSVAKSGGTRVFTIPNGTVVPARGHFLGVNSLGYSLNNYGGLNAATADATWTSGIADNTGLALFATDEPTTYFSSTPLDAVGFTSHVSTQYIEGPTGLTGIGAGPFAHNYSFVRKHQIGAGAALQDTGDSAADFALVAVDAGTYGATLALLGGPSPENLAAETERSNTEVILGGGSNAFTGAQGFGGSPKALEFRRTFTNNTAGTLSALRFKITSLTGVNSSTPGVADLRPTDSATVSTYLGLALEGMPSAGYIVTTPSSPGVPLPYPAGTLLNGGVNSTWRVPAAPIGPGGTVDVNFRVEYTLSGLPYLLWVVPEAK